MHAMKEIKIWKEEKEEKDTVFSFLIVIFFGGKFTYSIAIQGWRGWLLSKVGQSIEQVESLYDMCMDT